MFSILYHLLFFFFFPKILYILFEFWRSIEKRSPSPPPARRTSSEDTKCRMEIWFRNRNILAGFLSVNRNKLLIGSPPLCRQARLALFPALISVKYCSEEFTKVADDSRTCGELRDEIPSVSARCANLNKSKLTRVYRSP